jgi:hypothetical protein
LHPSPHPLVAALMLAALAVSGCGSSGAAAGSPGARVATVEGEAIMKADLDRWIAVFAGTQPRSGGPVAVPDPRRFAGCVAALARQPLPERAGRTSKAQRSKRALRARCQHGYEQLRNQAMAFLIESKWVEREAAERGIKVDDDALSERFDRELSDTFSDERALERQLASTGQTKDDALYRLRFVELQTRLMRRVKAEVEITDADVARHYRANRAVFDGPLATVEGEVARAVRAEREQQALQTFTADIRRRMRPKTWCAPNFRVAHCDNAPISSRAQTSPTDIPPRGAAQ